MNFKCNNCRAVVDECSLERERDPDWGWITVCPVCHSDDIEQVSECPECNHYVATEELCYGLCPDCSVKTNDLLYRVMAEKFSPAQIEYIKLNAEYIL